MKKTLGRAIKQLRMERGLSQQQLADMLYMDRSSIANWEADRRKPDIDIMTRLSELFGVDPGDLLTMPEKQPKTTNIIMVDDERLVLDGCMEVVREVLPEAGITGFTSPSAALEFAKSNTVDLAFLDIETGQMNGLELCRRLQEIDPRTNVVYLTAYAEYSFDAWDTNASGFLLKPLSVEKVRSRLAALRYPIGGTAS